MRYVRSFISLWTMKLMYAVWCKYGHLPPDQTINDGYLLRWWIVKDPSTLGPGVIRSHTVKSRFFSLYFHRFGRSDDARACHDHPAFNISFVLYGSYIEHRLGKPSIVRKPGSLVFRFGSTAHRIELMKDEKGNDIPVFSLWLVMKKTRSWGFWCGERWVHWKIFTGHVTGAEPGPGCGEP